MLSWGIRIMNYVFGLCFGVISAVWFIIFMNFFRLKGRYVWIPLVIITILSIVVSGYWGYRSIYGVSFFGMAFALSGLFFKKQRLKFLYTGIVSSSFIYLFYPVFSYFLRDGFYRSLFITSAVEIVFGIIVCAIMIYCDFIRFPLYWNEMIYGGGRTTFVVVTLWNIIVNSALQISIPFLEDQKSFLLIIQVLYIILLGISGPWLLYSAVTIVEEKDKNKSMVQLQLESGEYMKIVRSQRHDFNFHLHAISGLIENGEYEGCQNYVQNMIMEAGQINDVMPLRDAAIGSMLYKFRKNARKEGVDINYDITYDLANIMCNSYECNKILGNLLQNALDATIKQEQIEKVIDVIIMKRRGNSVIIVENQIADSGQNLNLDFLIGKSTKDGHEGIGLSVVEQIAQNYKGRFYTEIQNDKIRFVVNIPNKLI